MKRFIEVQQRGRTGSGRKAPVAIVAAFMLAMASPVAHAVSPVVKLRGSAALTTPGTAQGSAATPATFHVEASFSTDTPGAELFTIQKAVIFFPDHSGTNGRLFPSCSARQIKRFHGNLSRCPKGSKIGSGTVRAQALQLGVTAHGRVTMFNGNHGKSITFNFQTLHPAFINESLDAPLTQLHGRYGEKLTLVVPSTLQEILPDTFVGIEQFDVDITGAVHVRGVSYSYLKARTCPTKALHGVFDFANGTTGQTASATADTKVRCTVR